MVASTSSVSMARVSRLTAARDAPSAPEKNCSLYGSIVMGRPNLGEIGQDYYQAKKPEGDLTRE